MGNTRTNGRAYRKRYYSFEEALKASGMTQSELARKVGKTRQYISMVYNRHCRPSAKMIIRFDEVLGVDARAFR